MHIRCSPKTIPGAGHIPRQRRYLKGRRDRPLVRLAKQAGLYRGRQADTERHAAIADMLDRGMSWSQVSAATGASRSTIKRVVDTRKAHTTA